MSNNRKMSLFSRWKQQTNNEQLEGVSEEEAIEYREAFRLFDKVKVKRMIIHDITIFNMYIFFLKLKKFEIFTQFILFLAL